jgi:hypothetical protein
MTVVYSENHMKFMNAQRKKTKSFNLKAGGTYLYYSALKVIERKELLEN